MRILKTLSLLTTLCLHTIYFSNALAQAPLENTVFNFKHGEVFQIKDKLSQYPTNKQLRLSDIQALDKQGAFTHAGSGVILPNMNDVWFKFIVRNTYDSTQTIMLNMNSVMYNELELFALQADGTLNHILTGLNYPFDSRPIQQHFYVFPLSLAAYEQQTIFIRSNSWLQFPNLAYIADPITYSNAHSENLSWGHLFTGILLGVFVYMLVAFIHAREYKETLSYSIFLLLSLGVVLYCNGYMMLYLPDWTPFKQFLYPILVFGLIISFCQLTREFLQTDKNSSLIDAFLKLNMAISALAIASLAVLDMPTISRFLITYASFMLASLLLITSYLAPRLGSNGYMIALGHIGFLIPVAISNLSTEGILDAGLITQHGYEFGVCAQTIIFAFALSGKIQRYRLEASQSSILEAENKARTDFLAKMSHEIRTPMNGVLGTLELLKQSPLSTEQSRYVNIIESSSGILKTVLDDILDFSKIQSRKMEIENTSINLNLLIDDIHAFTEVSAHTKDLQLIIKKQSDLPNFIIGDSTRISQILLNLLSNAVKFTESGSISLIIETITDTQQKTFLKFTIKDTGIGLTEEQGLHIFDSFNQADSSITRRFGGTGLGLAICKDLTDLMGGDIGFTKNPQQGSNFWITLPLIQDKEPHNQISPKLPQVNYDLKILLAEDNIVNQQVILGMLKKIGLQAKCTQNGQEALTLFKQESFDLVFLDCEMPIMDGFTAVRQMRTWETQNNMAHTFIVAITAHAIQEYKEKCFEAGMDDHLSKPISFDALNRVIHTITQKAKPAQSN